MKKNILILSCFFLFAVLIPPVLAISTDMHESYLSGETMIAKISGNILETIIKKQVKFVDYSIGYSEIPLEYDIRRIGENHYLYAIMPFAENLPENQTLSYTLVIKGISTTVNGQRKEVDFMQNFSLSDELIPYTIKPGFIVTSDDFEITVNLNLDENLEVSTDFPASRSIILRPGENTISYSLEDVGGGIYSINLGDYTFPTLINKETARYLPPARFTKTFIESSILFDEAAEYELELINYGENDIEEARLEYNSEMLLISPEIPEILGAGESYIFTITLVEKNTNVDEEIAVIYGNDSYSARLYVVYTQNQNETGTNYGFIDSGAGNEALCSELGGVKCSSDESCSGNITSSKDQSQCCIGICSQKEGGRTYAWLGYLIGTILLLVLIVVGYRYFRTKRQKDNFDQKVREAEKKMVP